MPLRLAVLLALVLGPSSAWAACAEPVTGARLELLLTDAEAAWVKLDRERFGALADQIAAEVPCLSEPPDRAFAARYHRLQGLHAFAVRDSVRARSAFAASRRLEPASLLPSTFAPAGHPVQDAFVALPVEAVTTRPAPAPVEGNLYFDANKTQERPANVPTLFQWRDAAGAVRTTAYVWPTDPLPSYPAAKGGGASGKAVKRGTLLVGAGVTGALALGLTATTIVASERYQDDAMDGRDAELGVLRTVVNGSGGGAIGLGVAAGGLAVAAFVLPLGG